MVSFIWFVVAFFVVLFFWLYAEHLVERYMDGDWSVFWKDWRTVFLVATVALMSGFGFVKLVLGGILWAAGLLG